MVILIEMWHIKQQGANAPAILARGALFVLRRCVDRRPSAYGCTPLNSEEFMRRAVYHKVYVLKFFCKTKILGPFIWGIV